MHNVQKSQLHIATEEHIAKMSPEVKKGAAGKLSIALLKRCEKEYKARKLKGDK
jgi:hypothetical protein